LKIDATRVAVAPPGTVRVRDCTAAELSQAQAKFNALKPDAQRDSKKKIADARSSAACATCPKVQASAQKNYATQTKGPERAKRGATQGSARLGLGELRVGAGERFSGLLRDFQA
jgi:hypothetical protein